MALRHHPGTGLGGTGTGTAVEQDRPRITPLPGLQGQQVQGQQFGTLDDALRPFRRSAHIHQAVTVGVGAQLLFEGGTIDFLDSVHGQSSSPSGML
jgi:hypothetical protein